MLTRLGIWGISFRGNGILISEWALHWIRHQHGEHAMDFRNPTQLDIWKPNHLAKVNSISE